MRTTLTIDDDVISEARVIAAQEQRSLGSVISDLARRALAPVAITERDGFPIFDVPGDAPEVSIEAVAAAIDDE